MLRNETKSTEKLRGSDHIHEKFRCSRHITCEIRGVQRALHPLRRNLGEYRI